MIIDDFAQVKMLVSVKKLISSLVQTIKLKMFARWRYNICGDFVLFVMKEEPFLCGFLVPGGDSGYWVDGFDIKDVYKFIEKISKISDFENKTISIKLRKENKYLFFNIDFIHEERVIIRLFQKENKEVRSAMSGITATYCQKEQFLENCNFAIKEIEAMRARRN